MGPGDDAAVAAELLAVIVPLLEGGSAGVSVVAHGRFATENFPLSVLPSPFSLLLLPFLPPAPPPAHRRPPRFRIAGGPSLDPPRPAAGLLRDDRAPRAGRRRAPARCRAARSSL